MDEPGSCYIHLSFTSAPEMGLVKSELFPSE